MCPALLLMLLLSMATSCRGACSYPSNLLGDWYSTSFGTLTFTSSSFSGFTSAISATSLTFSCDISSGTQYVSKSTTSLFSGVTIDVYICMNLAEISSVKYYFTLDSNMDTGTGIRFYTSSASSVSLTDVCSVTDTRSAGEYDLLIKKDNISDSFARCPGELHSLFDITMTTQSVTNCNGSNLEGRSSTAYTSISFNYSSCATGQFNAGGYLSCLYTTTSDYVYVNAYNNDTSVDGSSSYRFTCFVITKDGATLYATESPGSCDNGQSPTSVESPGITYVMTDTLYVSTDEPNIVLIAVLCSFGIALSVFVVFFVYFRFIRKPKPEQPPRIRKRKRKPSITDYTPRITRSGSVEKDLDVKKKTAGEILTGTLNHKKDATLDGGGYEPPPKEVWQKKWETEMRPPTPTSKAGKTLTDTFSELPQGSKTASLPENLDRYHKPPHKLSKDSLDTTVSLNDMRYSERAHASEKIPESTGKFGNSPRPRFQDSLMTSLDTTLDPIKENPLSRESTATHLGKSARAHTTRTSNLESSTTADNRSLLSAALTTSTLSARDVHFTPYSNLSRSSRLSLSNGSIFEDPTWLNDNTKKTDTFFDVLKNLIPGMPQKQKDQRWFMKPSTKPVNAREDIEYYKNRNIRSIGISSLTSKRPQSSLEIIQNEKNKNSKKKTKPKPKEVQPSSSPHV